MLRLSDIIKEVELQNPGYSRIDFYYHADIYDDYTGDCLWPEEFIGWSSYYDGVLDTHEDQDGWTIEDEVVDWHYCLKQEEDPTIINISISLGRWN